jgi:hypothetical protein
LEPAATEQRRLASSDAYSAALAYVSDRIDIQGDIFATLREWLRGQPAGCERGSARRWRGYGAFGPKAGTKAPRGRSGMFGSITITIRRSTVSFSMKGWSTPDRISSSRT